MNRNMDSGEPAPAQDAFEADGPDGAKDGVTGGIFEAGCPPITIDDVLGCPTVSQLTKQRDQYRAERDEAVMQLREARAECGQAKIQRDNARTEAKLWRENYQGEIGWPALLRKELGADSSETFHDFVRRLARERDEARANILQIAQAVGIVHEADGQNPVAGPVDDIVRCAEKHHQAWLDIFELRAECERLRTAVDGKDNQLSDQAEAIRRLNEECERDDMRKGLEDDMSRIAEALGGESHEDEADEDAIARVIRERDEARAECERTLESAKKVQAAWCQLACERDRLRPVVKAADYWREHGSHEALRGLRAAVDTYRAQHGSHGQETNRGHETGRDKSPAVHTKRWGFVSPPGHPAGPMPPDLVWRNPVPTADRRHVRRDVAEKDAAEAATLLNIIFALVGLDFEAPSLAEAERFTEALRQFEVDARQQGLRIGAERAHTYGKNLRPGEDPRPHKLREYVARPLTAEEIAR